MAGGVKPGRQCRNPLPATMTGCVAPSSSGRGRSRRARGAQGSAGKEGVLPFTPLPPPGSARLPFQFILALHGKLRRQIQLPEAFTELVKHCGVQVS